MRDDLSGLPTTDATTEPALQFGDVELPAQRRDEPGAQHCHALGRRLQTVRWSRGWSLREFARRTGMDRHALSRIEAGVNTTLRLKVLWRLARSLGVHWAVLLDDHGTGLPAIHQLPVTFEQQLAALGARVCQVRANRDLTQDGLAVSAGTNRATISRVERGAQNITVDLLLRLAAELGTHGADLLDDRQTDARGPESQLREARAQADQLRSQLEQMRTRLTLVQARAAVATPVAERAAPKRIADAAEQARFIIDRYDRRYLAALSPTLLAMQLEGRRALYDHLDRIWRDGQRHRLDQRPEWTSLVALRDLAQHLTGIALDAHMRRN